MKFTKVNGSQSLQNKSLTLQVFPRFFFFFFFSFSLSLLLSPLLSLLSLTPSLHTSLFSPIRNGTYLEFVDRKICIEKDVCRTDRTLPFFEGDDNPNLVKLSDILLTYSMFNFDLGYVQGMNDLLSVILIEMDGNEVDSFWCFKVRTHYVFLFVLFFLP
jgi:hypothetical protein